MSKKESFVFLDFETTGLNPQQDRITQIAAIKIKNINFPFLHFELTEKFETLVNPKRYISEFITNLTGITNEMVKDKPSESEAIMDLIDFIGDSTIVAQNATFDLGFLHYAAVRAGMKPKSYNFYCTRAMTSILFPNISHKLGDIVDLFDIELENAHNAMSDATATQQLFEKTNSIYTNMGINMKNKIVHHQDRELLFTPNNAIFINPKFVPKKENK